MAKVSLTTIKNWFKTGLKPTQQQFWSTWDSFWHKDSAIPASSIENLNTLLGGKADKQALDHKVDKVTGKGLSEENFTNAEKQKLAGLSQIWELVSSGYTRLKDFAKSIQIKGLIIGDAPTSATDSTVYQNVTEDPAIGGELINTSSTVERTHNPTGTGYYFGANKTITRSGTDDETGTKGLQLVTKKTGTFDSLVLYAQDIQALLSGGGVTSYLIGQVLRVKVTGTETISVNGVARGQSADIEINNPNFTGYVQALHPTLNLLKGNITGGDIIFMDFDLDKTDPDLNITGDLTYLAGGGGSDVAVWKTKLEAINKKFRFIHNQGTTESDFGGIINYTGDVQKIIDATNKVLINKEYLATALSHIIEEDDAVITVFENTTHDAVIRILSSTSYKNSVLEFGVNKGKIIYDHSEEAMIFSIDATEYFRILSNGYIGVDISPVRPLHINSGIENEAARFETGETEVVIELKDATGMAKIKSRADFRFETGITPREAMRIDSNGNVGIKTETPTRTLDVSGKARIDDIYISGSEINTYSGGVIDFGGKREADGSIANSTIPNFRFAPNGTGTKGRVSIGKPGLGTIDANLHVVVGGSGSIVDATILEAKGNSGAGRGVGLLFRQPNSSPLTIDAARISASDGGLQIHTGAAGVLTEKVRVTSDGKVGIGTTTPEASAKLQLESTTQGFLPPRMTSAQKNAITSPAEGLMIYQTDRTKGWYGFDGASWVKF